MTTFKTWPHLTVVAVLFAVVGAVAAALWVKHEQRVQAETFPNAARLERVDGQVGINDSLLDASNDEWVTAASNTPISVGDRIFTRENSRAAIALSGRNFARLNGDSSLDVLSLSDRRTQLALRNGSALFDVGYLPPGDLFEVATPFGAVDLNQPGLYEVGLNDNGSAWISVLSGLAQVAGLAGSGQVSKGEMLTLLGQTAANIALSRLNPSYAGSLADDYYSYRYPGVYDGRYSNYDTYLNDPFYYDPYRRYASYQYASDSIPGLYDLDYYGDWQNVSGYGNVWQPRVGDGWAPYQSGSWTNDYPYGLTWVSNEPWGYAPYHYGRWANVNNQWFWVPDGVRTEPLYSPALVAFLPTVEDNAIGWVPLAPQDPYAYRYYDENWQPHYLNRRQVIPQQITNLNVPGAVTIVPWQDFDRGDYQKLHHGDWKSLKQTRPVFDPLALGPLRNAALRSAWGRGKIDLPPGIAKRLARSVVSNSDVVVLPFRKDLAKRLRVEAVPNQARNVKLKFKDEREMASTSVLTSKHEIASSARETDRGNKDARHEVRQIEKELRKQQIEQQRVANPENLTRPQQAQGERVSQNVKAERQAARQQVIASEKWQRQVRQGKSANPSREGDFGKQPRAEMSGPPVAVQNNEQRQKRSHDVKLQQRAERPQMEIRQQSSELRHGGEGKQNKLEQRSQVQKVQPSAVQPQEERGKGKGKGRH